METFIIIGNFITAMNMQAEYKKMMHEKMKLEIDRM